MSRDGVGQECLSERRPAMLLLGLATVAHPSPAISKRIADETGGRFYHAKNVSELKGF